MSVLPTRTWLPVWLLILFASPVLAQDQDRIWGEVSTVDGDTYEGFIRWDRNEGSWADVLNGSKEIPDESYEAWLQARRGGERPTRRIDLMGYRVTWNEEDPDFPSTVVSGLRFGHLAGLTVVDRDRIAVTLQSGERIELSGGSTDIGTAIRELKIDDSDKGEVELDWLDLDRIVFSAVPAGARPESRRLYGTVEDLSGRRFTGYVSWDLDEILATDVLDGEDDDGDDHEIEFRDIRAIEKTEDGARVTMASGDVLDLSGTNDVDRRHRGVQISDVALGMVEVEWDEFVVLRFEDRPSGHAYGDYDGGHRLSGTVVTEAGDTIAGRVRWDADEHWSWELLNGSSEGVAFTIEFGQIEQIERADSSGAIVTLLDGRTFHLEGSNDVDENNKGIFVEPTGGKAAEVEGAEETESELGWRYVEWVDFRQVRFEHPSEAMIEAGGA